jgi:hypothetical protein
MNETLNGKIRIKERETERERNTGERYIGDRMELQNVKMNDRENKINMTKR